MNAFRTEKDLLGECQVPGEALYGVHTVRALNNFLITGKPVRRELVRAYGAVKLACSRTNNSLGYLSDEIARAIERACQEMIAGDLDEHVVVDALQGGAGTSTNMNVNEVLANRALQNTGKQLGDYTTINPLGHVNLHQSTNDTFPTVLKIAAINQLRLLERAVVSLVESFQAQERSMAGVVKIGRTQYQEAVLTTLGREMSAYAEAFARDRWRIYKCEERLRVVNIGGTAIGTGLAAPRQYIFQVVESLREITGIGLARAENMVDCTQNADVFVEVSGILKACATNLLKVATDLRLLSSGPDAGIAEIKLEPRQAGSSIMPSKVNPVIPEAVSQAAISVMANDQAITQACAMGSLELNAFLPLVADSLLDSITLLNNACTVFAEFCVSTMQANIDRCQKSVVSSTAVVTALVSKLGYKKAEEVAMLADKENRSIAEMVFEQNLMSRETFDRLISAECVTRLGSPREENI